MIGLNNPLNIRVNSRNKWFGQIGSKKGFCNFASVDYCVRAACYLVMRSYCRQGFRDVSSIINRYAPKVENPTMNYVSFVCKRCGWMPNYTIRTNDDVAKLVVAMYYFESGAIQGLLDPFNEDYVLSVIKNFKIKFLY